MKKGRVAVLGIVLLIVLLALGILTGCGGGQVDSDKGDQKAVEQKQESQEKEQAQKDDFPKKPITLLCWSSPGSPVDLMDRQIAKIGQKYFGVPITVQNKTGGSGAIAMQALLKQPADGYTLLSNTRSMVVNITKGKIPYKLDDFKYITRIQKDPYVLVVPADSPFKTAEDMIKFTKENPGKLKVGGYGTDSAHALSGKWFFDELGVEINWIAYDGGSEAVAAGMGGHVDVVHTNPIGVLSQVDAGQMRVLATSNDERLDIWPDVPTYKELGVDIAPFHWRGIMTKADIPEERAKFLNDALLKTINDPEFKEFMEKGNILYGILSLDEYKEDIDKDQVKAEKLMKKLGIL